MNEWFTLNSRLLKKIKPTLPLDVKELCLNCENVVFREVVAAGLSYEQKAGEIVLFTKIKLDVGKHFWE